MLDLWGQANLIFLIIMGDKVDFNITEMTSEQIETMFKDYVGYILYSDGSIDYAPLIIKIKDAPRGLLDISIDLKKVRYQFRQAGIIKK